MADALQPIPTERREAARAALTAAFGARPVGGLRLLQGGISGASIWRVGVGAGFYVLRLEPERVALRDRQRGYDCMSVAAAAGVAPPVRYADPATGVAVTDFVESRPLSEHPGGSAGLVRALGSLTVGLRETPPFVWLTRGDVIADLLSALRGSGMFADGLLDGQLDGLARIRERCPWSPSAAVSSHNDPNPRNILFDGQRVWLVDWELAARNDPLFDLAILTTDLAAAPALETILLEAALGRPPDAAMRARMVVTRLLTRLFYGCIALEAFAGQPRAQPVARIDALSPADFRQAAAEGRFAAEGSDIGWAFGMMSLRAFTDGVAARGFDAALSLACSADTSAGG